LQNKPNFRNGQTGASSVLTKDYENKSIFGGQKNKAKQSQSFDGSTALTAGFAQDRPKPVFMRSFGAFTSY